MNKDFRDRVLLPIFLPVAVVAGFIGFAFALSRVLLAVSVTGSNLIALFLAMYLLGVAGLVAARPRIPTVALSIGLVVGLVAVGTAGVLAAQAGMREIHHADEDHGDGDGDGGEEPVADGIPEGAIVWVAEDIAFTSAPTTIPAGEVVLAIQNDGLAIHNVEFEGASVKVEANGGESASETVELAAGTYTYFCSIPGHRASGMEGEVTVE